MKANKKLNLTKEIVYQLTLSQKTNIRGGKIQELDDVGPGTTRTTRTKPQTRNCSDNCI